MELSKSQILTIMIILNEEILETTDGEKLKEYQSIIDILDKGFKEAKN